VGAGADSMPKSLVEQLKSGGRMIIPIGPTSYYQLLQCVDKNEQGKVSIHNITEVRYVPLQHV